ncbi:MAG: glycosyl hydrolase [Acidobacteria bacterium]|nr:glycosyl hydrolase [Acidobacteriota bacterium]
MARRSLLIFLLLLLAGAVSAQWVKRTVATEASFRGLAVVSKDVVWASGTGGTVIRTTDGGRSWDLGQVPGAERLDFRDIEAFDARTAYILSIGNGESSRIYKTTDGGKSWKLQFENRDRRAFFDAIACWDSKNCIAMSDPVEGHYRIIRTTDGETWEPVMSNKMAAAKDGEAAFAASGTCLITSGKNGAFLISGGADARVFRSEDRGETWSAIDTPIVHGSSGRGIFSIAMNGAAKGVIVGGDYEKPAEATDNLAFTSDGGKTWDLAKGLSGYRSGVAFIDAKTIIAVGTTGTDISRNGGKTWKAAGSESLNAVAAKGRRAVWAVGERGAVYKLK